MVTVDDCHEWIMSATGGPVSDADPMLATVLAAADAHLAANYQRPADGADSADWDLATVMLTARLWGRRQSPSGVAGVNDFGVVRVGRVDPDIASLLTAFRDHSDV